MASYLRPASLPEALGALAAAPWTIVAGATDHYPARVGAQRDEAVLDLMGLPALAAIEPMADGGWRIGALVTWSDVLSATLPPAFDGLRLAARQVGGPQIQNAATLAGNVCNASPAADGTPNLLVLDAGVELRSVTGVRVVRLADFVLGNRRTARRADELVTALVIPPTPAGARATFAKLGSRSSLVISIASVAGLLLADASGHVAEARLAVGACSEVPQRLHALEAALVGCPADGDLGAFVAAAHLAPLSPIDDVRGTATYRLDAVATLVRRVLGELGA